MRFQNSDTLKILSLFLSLFSLCAVAQTAVPTFRPDSAHLGVALEVMPGRVLKIDPYERMWLHENKNVSVGLALNYRTRPEDADSFAADYNYPTFSVGLLWGNYHNVTMHKEAAPDWGQAVPVGYVSRMGQVWTLYGGFLRPLLRRPHWEVDYALNFGVGIASRFYNRHNNVDNELLGSRWNIYFGAGLRASYWFSPHWAMQLGMEFRHHSNGALDRPNKGENSVGPSLTLLYYPSAPAEDLRPQQAESGAPSSFARRFYWGAQLGIGGKSLLEDWIKTQYNTPPSHPDYRTGHFRIYPTYSLQFNFMYRYARRWASGLGLDLNYAQAAHHIAALDRAAGIQLPHSPWSVGLAARHEVFYHNLSLAMSLGVYLHRQMGQEAKWEEKPYYERIGLRYHFPRWKGFYLGGDVKAHLTKADFTEFVIGMEF